VKPKFFKRQTKYFVGSVINLQVVHYYETTYIDLFDRIERNPTITDALTDLSEWVGIENYQATELLLNDVNENNLDIKTSLETMFFEIPHFLDLVNAAILFDYADKMKLNQEYMVKFPYLQDMFGVKGQKEEEMEQINYADFMKKTMRTIRCFNRLVVDFSEKQNDHPQEFYGTIKRKYIEEFEEDDLIQVMHWCVFSKDQTLKEKFKATMRNNKDMGYESWEGNKQNWLYVKFWVPENWLNAYVIKREKTEYVIIPPFTTFKLNYIVNSSIKMTVWKDNKAFLNYNFGKRNQDKLFEYPSTSSDSESSAPDFSSST
jgi:hypothetical protein